MRTRCLSPLPFVAIGLAALVATGCLTPASEQRMGDEAAAEVAQTMGFVSDAALVGYVREIGERLAAVSERPEGPWRFVVVDVPEPNAFALPGGHIYVTRGLLALCNSEDELAGVIGHEIAHVTARHGSRRVGAAIVMAPINIATGIAGFATSIVSPTLGNAVAGSGQLLTQGLVLAPFSRSQENEADEIGQGLAAKAGYDPSGISHFLHTLDRYVRLHSGGEPPRFNFLASHPMTPDRVEKTAERATRLQRSDGRPIAVGDAFLGRIEGIVVGEDPAQGVFRNGLFLHPVFDLAIAFPAGWRTMNTAAAAGSVSPSDDALVALQLAARDTSLDAVVRELQEEQSDLAVERFEIHGLPAARARASGRGQRAVITWIGHRGDVFAVVGQTTARGNAYDRAFDAAARSFRPLRRDELDSITELRLRLSRARDGETPEGIARRTGSAWRPAELAVANGVGEDARFRREQAVKVALREPHSR